jgi:hypothetical protein
MHDNGNNAMFESRSANRQETMRIKNSKVRYISSMHAPEIKPGLGALFRLCGIDSSLSHATLSSVRLLSCSVNRH